MPLRPASMAAQQATSFGPTPLGWAGRRGLLALWLALQALLVACGGGGAPSQEAVVRNEMVGSIFGLATAGSGEQLSDPVARGAAGLQRTAAQPPLQHTYAVSLTDLTGPYALRARTALGPLAETHFSLAVQRGVANITPLSTLLVAQLYGQDPAAVFDGFGAGGATDTSRVDADTLAQAQAGVAAFVLDTLGVDLALGDINVITTPFEGNAAQAMTRAMAGIHTALQQRGQTWAGFTQALAQAARLCLVERLALTRNRQTGDFCPQTKRAVPRAGDPSVIDHTFVDRHGQTLRLATRAEAVLAIHFEARDGSIARCEVGACAALALGPAQPDLTRLLQFKALTLAGPEGATTLEGSLHSAVPGVELPVLPCDSNLFYVVLPDASVAASCVDPDPGGFGLGGTLSSLTGVAPSRASYVFALTDTTDPTRPQVSVTTDANDAVLAVEFIDFDPDGFTPRRRFVCQGAGCNGVTLGPVTTNTDVFGEDLPVLIRSVEFRDTRLAGYAVNGDPTGTEATLKASLTTAYLNDFEITYPPSAACPDDTQPVTVTAEGGAFDTCVPRSAQASLADDGVDVELSLGRFDTATLVLTLRDGLLWRARLSIDLVGSFQCDAGCPGLQLSAPDAQGRRQLAITSAALHERLYGPVSGPRSLVLDAPSWPFEVMGP